MVEKMRGDRDGGVNVFKAEGHRNSNSGFEDDL